MATIKKSESDVSPGGEWLFRAGDLTLGPVKGAKLVEKLFSGEVTGVTQVTLLGQNSWRPLKDVDGFKLQLAKAEAKLRVDDVRRTTERQALRARNNRMVVIGVVALAFAAAAAGGARYLAVHNPWKNADELAFADIFVEPPKISLARHGAGNEELLAYPGEKGGRPTRRPAERFTRVASAGQKGPATGTPRTEADGMEMARFDQGGINNVVAARQKSLYPCFVEEARRSPGLNAKIPIEFVIGNDGRVNKLWVDNPSFKEGPLPECLIKELQKWPFKPYEGERATVALSFQIGRHS